MTSHFAKDDFRAAVVREPGGPFLLERASSAPPGPDE